MPYSVSKVEVWTSEIADQVGGLAAKLEPLAGAGVDLQFVIARRQAHIPGKGVVFLSGRSGPKAAKAALAAGLVKATDLAALRVEAPNKPGDCHKVTRLLADAGISLRGLSASVIGNRYVLFLAFDTAADANKAARLLRAADRKRK
ncbi:MAG: amino acid-binding protein [Planctomycetes bacterium]|nr:amino acid-binding protein [Planctomycetota bacterium]